MDYTVIKSNLKVNMVRFSGLLFVLAIIVHSAWTFNNLNTESLVFSIGFLIAMVSVYIYGLVAVFNSWNLMVNFPKSIKPGPKPKVAIAIPTHGEPIEMVLKTIVSIIEQDWPKNKMVIIVGDDKQNNDLKLKLKKLSKRYGVEMLYHTPPHKSSPNRKGEAKSGNLNSCLEVIRKNYPDIQFIETRDADDLVGNRSFLRLALTVLENDKELSFVQTIKRCVVADGDLFSNQESVFYERCMPARNSANSVFPCGSGLVWRVSEVTRIGGFPTWNLVEDLHSGHEILSVDGKGAYLPIVGALGQVAPEDIPNLYKQRGTWAIDTLRLFFWKNPLLNNGFNIKQKMQFFELQFSYLLSISMILFTISLFVALVFDIHPIKSSSIEYIALMSYFAISNEFFNIARAGHVSYAKLWRSRQIWMGLMFVFLISVFKALIYGPHKKPRYIVTRKHHMSSWYFFETLPQLVVLLGLLFAVIQPLFMVVAFNPMDLVSIFWSCFFIFSLSHIVRISWHGTSPIKVFEDMLKIGIQRLSFYPNESRNIA